MCCEKGLIPIIFVSSSCPEMRPLHTVEICFNYLTSRSKNLVWLSLHLHSSAIKSEPIVTISSMMCAKSIFRESHPINVPDAICYSRYMHVQVWKASSHTFLWFKFKFIFQNDLFCLQHFVGTLTRQKET